MIAVTSVYTPPPRPYPLPPPPPSTPDHPCAIMEGYVIIDSVGGHGGGGHGGGGGDGGGGDVLLVL